MTTEDRLDELSLEAAEALASIVRDKGAPLRDRIRAGEVLLTFGLGPPDEVEQLDDEGDDDEGDEEVAS